MLQTLERTATFDARMLLPGDREALLALCGAGGLPQLPRQALNGALADGRLLGDFGGGDTLQAAAALLPLYDEGVLPASLRAAGYGADGQGAVLTPPLLAEHYTQLRQFLRTALRLATTRYASYHVWAVQPLDTQDLPRCEDLCAQYLSAGLTLRAVRPMAGANMMVFSARGSAPLAGTLPPPAPGGPRPAPHAGARLRRGGLRLGSPRHGTGAAGGELIA